MIVDVAADIAVISLAGVVYRSRCDRGERARQAIINARKAHNDRHGRTDRSRSVPFPLQWKMTMEVRPARWKDGR